MQRWGGRFKGGTDERVVEFTRSVDIDADLAADDIAGSIAHVHGLGRAGILAPTRSTSSSRVSAPWRTTLTPARWSGTTRSRTST